MIKNSLIVSASNLKTGIGRYAWSLYKLGILENFIHFSYNGKSDFKDYITVSNHWSINTFTSLYLGGSFKKYLKKYNFIHSSATEIFHLYQYNKNMVGTFHDLFPLKYPNNFSYLYRKFWEKNLKYIVYLKGVITNSNYVKIEAKEKFKDVDFIKIHLWVDNEIFKIRNKLEVREKLNLNKEKIYLLNVSVDRFRKNIDLLPKIMNKLDDRFVLIRIGKTDRIYNNFKNKKNVLILENVSDNEFPLYYNASDILIHTSIDGGFEYPYIEAITSNLNVISFDLPISREVLRDKGIFIPLINK
ncbi:MAG: glycosyltransferase, partial [Thermoplasmata archaeon]